MANTLSSIVTENRYPKYSSLPAPFEYETLTLDGAMLNNEAWSMRQSETILEGLNTGYQTVVSLTGPGVVDFLALIQHAGTASATGTLRLTVDGVLIANYVYNDSHTVVGRGHVVIGGFNVSPGDQPGGIAFEPMQYDTSLLLEVRTNVGAATVDMTGVCHDKKI
jgi:hypothetical protein